MKTIALEISHYSGAGVKGWTLRIHHDDHCGRLVLEANITPEQFSALLGHHPQVVEAEVYKSGTQLEKKRLSQIASIIESVDDRAMACDGPVTPTLQEMTQKEMDKIYKLASKEK